MKKVLLVYTKMIIGGSTTSLLSLLNSIDYSKVSIDLLLNDNSGELQYLLPHEVNVLELPNMKKRKIDFQYLKSFIKSRTLSFYYSNELIKAQIMSAERARFTQRLSFSYDIAIGFLEFWPCEIVKYCVDAKRKIGWLHIDYQGSRLLPKVEESLFSNLDNIVLVSKTCRENFESMYPSCALKTKTIQNILTSSFVRKLSEQYATDIHISNEEINIVSVARIEFSSKGHDRGLRILKEIRERNRGLLFRWFIIGDGVDMIRFKKLVDLVNMQDIVIFVGSLKNPYPYLKLMDILFVPSRYEGKPMVVTEAQMLGVVPFVSEYSSAYEQIIPNVDGFIAENLENEIMQKLEGLMKDTDILNKVKKTLLSRDYSNQDEIEKFYDLISE